jgi:hypothetical protein
MRALSASGNGEVDGWASGIESVLERIEGLTVQDRAALALPLLDDFFDDMEDMLGQIDDSDGESAGLIAHAADIHLKAWLTEPKSRSSPRDCSTMPGKWRRSTISAHTSEWGRRKQARRAIRRGHGPLTRTMSRTSCVPEVRGITRKPAGSSNAFASRAQGAAKWTLMPFGWTISRSGIRPSGIS